MKRRGGRGVYASIYMGKRILGHNVLVQGGYRLLETFRPQKRRERYNASRILARNDDRQLLRGFRKRRKRCKGQLLLVSDENSL